MNWRFDNFAYEVVGIPDLEVREEEEQPCEEEAEFLSSEKQLETLALAREILERHGGLCDEARKAFGNCQRHLRNEKTAYMKQITIFDQFLTNKSSFLSSLAVCIPLLCAYIGRPPKAMLIAGDHCNYHYPSDSFFSGHVEFYSSQV